MRREMNANSQKGTRALEVMRASLDPRNLVTAPPMLSAMSASTKSIDLSGNFIIDDSALTGEKILTGNGLVLDFVMRSVASVFRFGIVPARAVSPQANIPYVENGTDIQSVALLWTRPVPVPYYDDGVNQIQVGPDLSESFSMTRKYSGVVTVVSDTVAIGSTSLNGILSGASIADTRDVAQSNSAVPTCFDPANIMQCSTNAKDGVRDVPIATGITSLVGPDINVGYTQPVMDNVVNGTFGSSVSYKCNYKDVDRVVVPSEVYRMTLYTGFASPWGVKVDMPDGYAEQLWKADGTGKLGPTVNWVMDYIDLPQINICGTIRYRVEIRKYGLRQSPSPGGTVVVGGPTLHVTATDFFACALPNGSIKYTTRSCTKTQYLPAYNNMVNFNNSPSLIFDMDQSEWGHGSIGSDGMYVGTFFRMFILFDYLSAGAATVVPLRIDELYITALPTTIYRAGELGPVRVIRWDGLSQGQVVRIDGKLNVQCVAQGAIAPFIQEAAMFSDTGSNLNIYPLMYEMYNGPTMFKRIWSHDEYVQMVQALVEQLSQENMALAHNKLVTMASAAGVFDNTHSGPGVFGPGVHKRHR